MGQASRTHGGQATAGSCEPRVYTYLRGHGVPERIAAGGPAPGRVEAANSLLLGLLACHSRKSDRLTCTSCDNKKRIAKASKAVLRCSYRFVSKFSKRAISTTSHLIYEPFPLLWQRTVAWGLKLIAASSGQQPPRDFSLSGPFMRLAP